MRVGALAGGTLPVLAFPRSDVDWLAWVALVPGILACRLAPGGREAAVRGWWLGAGFLMAAFYWLLPSIGPGLPLVAVVFGVLWAGWGYLAWLDTDRRGTVTVSVSALPESLETIYDRSGDIVPLLALPITTITAAGPTRRAVSPNAGVRRTPRPTGHGRDNEEEQDDQLTGRS